MFDHICDQTLKWMGDAMEAIVRLRLWLSLFTELHLKQGYKAALSGPAFAFHFASHMRSKLKWRWVRRSSSGHFGRLRQFGGRALCQSVLCS